VPVLPDPLFGSLVIEVNGWIKEFLEPIGTSFGVPLPTGLNVLPLSKDGRLVGLDGHPLANGHLDEGCKQGLLSFPESCLSAPLTPLDELRASVQARLALDQRMIDGMLEDPAVKAKLAEAGWGADAGEPIAIKCMHRGRARVAECFAGDCHLKMATCILPPTASMLKAVYSPDKLYRARKVGE
jgi:hypothetical protein